MAIDQNTWGFSKSVAEALQASIVNGETEIPDRLPGTGGSGGGGGGDVLYAFIMASDMVAGQAHSDFFLLDGDILGETLPGATLYDPVGVFASLTTGTEGYCIKQGGRYYAIQAKCPTEYL